MSSLKGDLRLSHGKATLMLSQSHVTHVKAQLDSVLMQGYSGTNLNHAWKMYLPGTLFLVQNQFKTVS